MKLYSDFPARRTRQILGDLFAVGLIGAWIWLGVFVYELVMNLSDFGVQMEDAGSQFRETMTEVSSTLGDVPLIGGGIRAPFDGASDAGAALEAAGVQQQVAVQQLATGLGIGIAVLPVLTILVIWLVPRIRFALKASATKKQLGAGASLDLLALRALSTQKLSTLTALDSDPLAAWRRGDTQVVKALAQLELRSSGVRLD
jgi:hypothetical protein